MKGREIIEEAKKRFPIGSKVRSAFSGEVYMLESHRDMWDESDQYLRLNGTGIYYQGKWAEVLSYPEGTENLMK